MPLASPRGSSVAFPAVLVVVQVRGTAALPSVVVVKVFNSTGNEAAILTRVQIEKSVMPKVFTRLVSSVAGRWVAHGSMVPLVVLNMARIGRQGAVEFVVK